MCGPGTLSEQLLTEHRLQKFLEFLRDGLIPRHDTCSFAVFLLVFQAAVPFVRISNETAWYLSRQQGTWQLVRLDGCVDVAQDTRAAE